MNKQKLEKFANLELDMLNVLLSLSDADVDNLLSELENIIQKYKEKAIENDVLQLLSKLSDEEKKKLLEKLLQVRES